MAGSAARVLGTNVEKLKQKVRRLGVVGVVVVVVAAAAVVVVVRVVRWLFMARV